MRLSIAESFGQQAARADTAVVTRFAPSPNGALHLGHAYAAIAAHDFARAAGGKFLLRIEDIDGSRSRLEHIEGIIGDLKWLGLAWDGEVIFQSKRTESYAAALSILQQKRLVYPCVCTRTEIAAALKDKPVRHGPDGPHYPGSCRPDAKNNRSSRAQSRDDLEALSMQPVSTALDMGGMEEGKPHCWRLDMAKAVEQAGPLVWHDMAQGEQQADPALFGDIVLWRKDTPASYHLAATLDDAADGITHIVRGQDLFAYSGLHRLLQALLGLREPSYWHHPLIMDEAGEKLAKSRQSAALSALREAGESGDAIANAIRKSELPLGMTLSEA